MFNSRLTIYKRLQRIILLLLLAAFLLAGCLYAYTRDLSKGCNKIYVTANKAEGQVAVTETVEQWFVPGHGYDGVSLLLDHNKIANAGSVTVTIYRASDDECVLQRTIPVVETSRGGYTYFASRETIEAEAGEAFYLVATYSGPAAGVVVARTGEMPEAVAGQCSVGDAVSPETVALGVVTDYQNDPTNTRLLLAAFVVMTIALGALVIGWNSIKRNTGRGKATFLAAYYGVITGLFLIALSMSAQRTYEPFYLGAADISNASADDRWPLKDDGSLDAYITLPAEDICGIQIPVYVPDYLYTSETITLEVQELGTNRVLQTSEYAIADIGTDRIYLALDDRYDAGTRLGLHIVTHGMVYRECPGFYIADAGDSGNSVYYGGAKQEGQQMFAAMYRADVTYAYTRPVLFYGIAVLIGIVLMWELLYKKRLIWNRIASPVRPLAGPLVRHDANNMPRKQVVALFVFTVVFGVLVIDYSYTLGVRSTQDCIYPEFVSYSADGMHEWETIPTDGELTQTLVTNRGALCGIALTLSANGEELSNAEEVDADIVVQIEDAEGDLVGDAQYSTRDLEFLRMLLAEDYTRELPQGFYYIPLDESLHIDAGTNLTIRIAAVENQGMPLYIAENPIGQVHLMAVYNSYAVLPRLYWPVMVLMMLAIMILALIVCRPVFCSLSVCVGLAALTGVLLSMVIPPFCIPDELTHFKEIYHLSNTLLGVYDAAGPEMIYVPAEDSGIFRLAQESITIANYNYVWTDLFHSRISDGIYEPTAYMDVIRSTSVWNYLPSMIGLSVSRILGLNVMTGVMMSRWSNLLVALVLMSYGIRKSPIGRNGMMVILLFPQLLQIVTSCSYDAMLLAFAFLFIGNTLHLLYDDERTAIDYMLTLVSALLLGVNKYGVYLPILCLLLMPLIHRILRDHARLFIGMSIVCGCVIATAGVRYAASLTDAAGAEIYSVADFLHDPWSLLHILEHTVITQADTLFVNMIGSGLGVHEIVIPDYIIVAICIMLYLAWRSERGTRERIGCKSMQGILMIVGIGSLMICVAMTVGMTPVGSVAVDGLQGRYFLPYFLLGSIVMADHLPEGRAIPQYRILYGMGLVHIITIGIVFVRVFAPVAVNSHM